MYGGKGMEKRFLTVREAEEFLNGSQSACRLQISDGGVRCALAGGRVLIEWLHLEERAASGQLLETVERPEPDAERKGPKQNRKPEQLRFSFAVNNANPENAKTGSEEG
jgi:hypothetical protein